MYKVVHNFRDLQDRGRLYKVGEPFPRPGKTVTQERLSALESGNNKAKRKLIEKIEEPKPEKPKRTRKKKEN